MAATATLSDVIVEFQPQGAYVRVSAFDPASMTEVSIVGAAAAGHAILERMVLKKLDWVLARKRG